ncbi:MAG: thioesterase domain-containing protein [Cyanobacteria bacterium P01_G01_bin.54]
MTEGFTADWDDWLIEIKPNPTATCRLFCLPYNGGSITAFDTWPEALPETVAVYGIQLPGGVDRRHEAPLPTIDAVVQALVPPLLPYLDRPFALYGHSLGALVAFELACAMRQTGDRQPLHLFVGAWGTPHLPNPYPHLQHHTDAEIIAQILPLVDVPPTILSHAKTMQVLLPLLKTGAQLHEDYQYAPRDPLDCPISALRGEADQVITTAAIQAWQQHTCKGFQAQVFPGNHLFLHQAQSLLLDYLTQQLTPVTRS